MTPTHGLIWPAPSPQDSSSAPDLSAYALKTELTPLAPQTDVDNLDARVDTLEATPPVDLAPYALKTELTPLAQQTDVDNLDARVDTLEAAPPVDLAPLEGRVTALEGAAPGGAPAGGYTTETLQLSKFQADWNFPELGGRFDILNIEFRGQDPSETMRLRVYQTSQARGYDVDRPYTNPADVNNPWGNPSVQPDIPGYYGSYGAENYGGLMYDVLLKGQPYALHYRRVTPLYMDSGTFIRLDMVSASSYVWVTIGKYT